MACFVYATHFAHSGRAAGAHQLGRGGHALLSARADARRAFPEPGVPNHYAPSWSFRVLHAEVHLRLDPDAPAYRGTTRFRIAGRVGHEGPIRLDLAASVPVHAVSLGEGEEARWRRDGDTLRIDVGPLGAGREVSVTVDYGGPIPPAGLYATGPTKAAPSRTRMLWTQCQDEDAHRFMPCLDHPRVKHPWRVTLEGPADCRVVGNGREVSHGVVGDRVVGVFEQAEPMPAYLFTAVCGRFLTLEADDAPVPVRFFVPVHHEDGEALARRAMGRTGDMIRHFAEVFGDYPWPRYDQVVVDDFVFGGMENTAATTMTTLLLADRNVGPHWDPEDLVSHELAHQWFGDLVTCQDWSQAWLNESFATLLETYWREHVDGADEAAWYAFGQFAAYLGEDGARYRRPIQHYRFREPLDVFDRHLYEKGAVVLRTLRARLGREAFEAGVRHYLATHAHGTVHTRHLVRALEEVTGRNLDRFVHEWIQGAGHPELKVAVAHAEGWLTVTVTQTQVGDETAAAFDLRVPVEVVGPDGAVAKHVLPVADREARLLLPAEAAPRCVRVDPGFTVAATVSLEAPEEQLVALSEDPAPVLAVRAVRALAGRDTPVARRAVVAALTDHPHHGVRAEAAGKLAERADDEAVDALLRALDLEDEPRALSAVAKGLGRTRSPRAAEALRARLQAELPTWSLRAAILEGLGATRAPGVVEALRPWLEVASWGDTVRAGALAGLAASRAPEALEVLLTASRADWDERGVAAVASALGAYGEAVPDARRACRERLEELLQQGGFRVRLFAARALGALGDAEAQPALARAHRVDADGRVRRFAWEALAALRAKAGGDQALGALRDRFESLQRDHAKLQARLDKIEAGAREKSQGDDLG